MRESFKFKNLENPIELSVFTKSPTKWLLIDRETGQVFQGSENGYWDRLEPVIKENTNDRD